MKLTNLRNTLLAAALCLSPSALMAAAGGIPVPNPQPNPQHAPADVQMVWGGSYVQLNTFDFVGRLEAIITVSDAQTGLAIDNLSKGNFTASWSNVYPLCAPPEIKAFYPSPGGLYRMTFGFSESTLCTWKAGQYPVALQVYSTFNPGNPFSVGSYQGQVASLVQLH
jgi:hypothetical protein